MIDAILSTWGPAAALALAGVYILRAKKIVAWLQVLGIVTVGLGLLLIFGWISIEADLDLLVELVELPIATDRGLALDR